MNKIEFDKFAYDLRKIVKSPETENHQIVAGSILVILQRIHNIEKRIKKLEGK